MRRAARDRAVASAPLVARRRSADPLISARDVAKGFGSVQSRCDGVSIELGARRERRPGRRVRLGQDDARALPARARDARRRADRRSTGSTRATIARARRPRRAAAAARGADRLPGSLLVAQPGAHDRRARSARRSPMRRRRRGRRRRRAARAGRPARRTTPAQAGRALGRRAPAGRDRPRARRAAAG